MKFKIGDRVNFLNEKGGGKVVAIIDSKLVKIETDDGFELPVMVTDLIRDFRADPTAATVAANSIDAPAVQHPPAGEQEGEHQISLINPWGTVKEESGIYIAFVPHEQQWLLTGDLDVYVINHTRYDILFSLFFRQPEALTGVDFGSIPAESKWLVETISREEIESWCEGVVQVMFHQDEPQFIYLPVHSNINLRPSRFYKEGSFQANSLLQDKALVLSLAPESTFEKASGSEQEQKFGVSLQAKKAEEQKKKPLIDKHKTALFEAVVDLHIGELVDNIAGLSNHDMFQLQIAYFRKTLESAIKNDYQKVTFIHGVGNGVLKNAVIKELEDYEDIENKKASISKFGVGAVDVLIKTKV